MKEPKTGTFIRRSIRIVLWTIAVAVGVVILALGAFQFPGVQHFIARKIVASIAEKTGTRIEIGSVEIAFTHSVLLRDIFIESRERDTLLSARVLAADINLLGLLTRSLSLTNIRIDSLTAHITRRLPDSSYNFDFLLNEFGSGVHAGSASDHTTAPGWDIQLGGMSFRGFHVTYDDAVSGMNARLLLGSMDGLIEDMDIGKRRIHIGDLTIERADLAIARPDRSGGAGEESGDAGAPVNPWTVVLDNVILDENSVRYDVRGAARSVGLDPNHLRLNGLRLRAENIVYGAERMTATIKHASVRDHSGFELKEMSGECIIDSLHAECTNFTVATPASRLRASVYVRYPSIASLRRLSDDVNVKATIEESHVALSDLRIFRPGLPIRSGTGAVIHFSSKLSGSIGDLRIEEFKAALGDSTALDLTGRLRGLRDPATAYVDLQVRRCATGRNVLLALVADTLLPKDIALPAFMNVSGEFKGTKNDFSASAVLSTTFGTVKGNGTYHAAGGPGAEADRWEGDAVAENLDIGALLRNRERYGPVSLKATARGSGWTRENVRGEVSLDVDRAVVNGYPYRRFSLHASALPDSFELTAEMRDSNLAFTLAGAVGRNPENPNYRFLMDLKGADLRRLRVSSDDIRVAGVVTADLTGHGLNDLTGGVGARNVVIIKGRKRYIIDSLMYASVRSAEATHISLRSTFLDASFDGTIALGDLPAAVREHFGKYFTLHTRDTANVVKPQAFAFQVTLRDPRILTEVFLPQFDHLSAGVIEGRYDSKKMALNVNVEIATVAYGGFEVDSLTLRVTSDNDRLRSTVRVGSAQNAMLRLTNVELRGSVERDSIDLALESTDGEGRVRMLLAGICTGARDGYRFRFRPDGVVFQDVPWSVPADNGITFGSRRFSAHNVVLSGAGQSLSFNSLDSTTGQPPLKIECANFRLSTLARVVERDTGLVRGVLNGNVVLRNPGRNMAFTSDLAVKDFTFDQRLVGDIALKASNETEDVYALTMGVSGNDNDIAVRGTYLSKEGGSELDLAVDVRTMNLASMEAFTPGYVRRLSGTMSGAVRVQGTLKKPSIAGNLKFTHAAFEPEALGSYLRVENGRIILDGAGIHFGAFEVIDTLGNTASLSGDLFTENYRDFRYGFRMHTENFLLMNRPASRDALYYGTVYLDSDIEVGGDRANPVIRMQAQLDKGTNLALVMPESETDLQQRRGTVRFVDLKNPQNPIMARRATGSGRTRDSSRTSRVALDLTANVEVDKDARLRILIDPIAGDSLVIRGEATFSLNMDPGGKLSVTGRYEILEGTYQLSFGELIRREFAIEKGSSITWLGAVTEADVNITAIYTAKTSALDLVQDQLTGLSQEERNKYKQVLRIQVYLTMDGKLLEPTIHFRLDLPPDQRGVLGGSVYAKLNELNGQESELNKQVFALLVLGRFIPTNPLASVSKGEGLTGLARSSVSQILTEQLNRLSEKVITGVSLNVGVESYQDYSAGTPEGRTQLQLALTKTLFDERVSVQVGGNVDVEGERSRQNTLNSFAGDIKVGYKLTEDGRWQLQVFRKNTNEGAIEGDLVETGVGIVFTIDYDKLFGFGLRPSAEKAKTK